MSQTFEEDREYLISKYHKQDGSFEEQYLKDAHLNTKYGRMAFHGYEYDPQTGMDDEEIRNGLRDMQPWLDKLSHPVAKAEAIKFVLEHTRIDVNEHDYFVGIYSWDRLCREVTVSRWDEEVFREKIPQIKDELDDLNASGANLYWPDYDHVVVDWLAVMELGFPGLLERTRTYRRQCEAAGELTEEKAAFYDSIIIEYSAIIDFVDRLYRYACTKSFEKAPKIAQCLKQLRDGAPTDTYEALQLMYLFFMIIESVDCYQCRSLGNGLDRTLQRFYDADIASGRYTKGEIRELLAYFLMQFSAIGNYWGQPFYLGGTDEEGKCRITELSYLIIDVYKELGLYNPKVQIKVAKDTPHDFMDICFDMIRNGQNSIVFCCEENFTKLLMKSGVSYEEALDHDVTGCYEVAVRGDHVCTTAGNFNLAKPLLYALYNGIDNTIGKKVGITTGDPDSFAYFGDFYHAVLRQLDALIEKAIRLNHAAECYLGYVNPSGMYSATIRRSLERGTDGYQAGVRFNDSNFAMAGLATLIDSVMAVKYLVYDKKACTIKELTDALDADWKGYEKLRFMALHCPHKYGNGDRETDIYTSAISDFITLKISNRPNHKGGVYKCEAHSPRFVWQGLKTQATPDGRHAGEELSKNASPSVGMDRNGATALIRSVLKIHPENFMTGSCLDLMLHPSTVSGKEGLEVFHALVRTYFANGGPAVHFNVFDAQKLREAQKEPEKYANLQVRVCGWNARWNNLTRQEQDAYIRRAENIVE